MTQNLGFYKKVLSAWRGMRFYKKMLGRQQFSADTFILIQRSDDDELVGYGNKYLPQFIDNNDFKDIIILSASEYKTKLGSGIPDMKIINCPLRRLDDLIRLYCMWRFTTNILIFSTDVPSSNGISRLMSSGVLNKEEAVAIGIYKLNAVEG